MVNPSYQSEVSEIRFLIGAANTQELRNQVRTRIAELITNTSALLSKLAEDLGFDLVKSGRRRITRLMLEEELERRFPPLRNPQEDELPVPIEFEKRNEIFLPPETQEPRSGESEFVPPRVFPRTRLAIEVLERMGLDLSNCIFMEGINVPNMMRTLSYRAIVITEIQKAILVCDEERNKTFIIYESENIERYYRLRKNELKDLSSQGIVADLIWCEPEKWQARLEDLLRSRPEHIQPEEPPEEVPDAPEGWMTNSALAREIGVTHRVVKRMAKEYREEHPEWFVRYRFGTGRGRGSYEHFSPELCDIIRARINEYEIAPEGWMTNSALVNELEVSDTLTKKIANKYHETNPEWSARYRLRTGKSYEAFVHYSPELCDIIRARINEYETAPEGWMTNSALANELEVSYTLTKKIANKYRQTNSEWFREYKHKMGHIREHYSPELCNIIRARINEYETAPEGWLTNSTLAKGLDVDWTTIQKLIQPYRQTHPQWFVVYNINEHFSPELCDIIRTKINEYETAPEGWLTNGGLADELNVANDTTKRRAEVYRKEYPEWFREYKTTGKKGGVVREHFSPELCDIIRTKINEYEKAPEGWMTNGGLSNELEIGDNFTKKIADEYRQTNPDWFKNYKCITNEVFEHYSPGLCDIIRTKINECETVPEGWMTNNGLVAELQVAFNTIRAVADEYRDINPEWFMDYKDVVGKLREHFSPELCDIIRTKINEYEKAPEGWMTNNGLVAELQVAFNTIRAVADEYRDINPEWFREYKTTGKKGGVVREHFSPELCDIIRTKINEYEKAPEGWMTNTRLSSELEVDFRTVKVRADTFRDTHPEWFMDYKDVVGKLREHYSPELCDILKKELDK